MLKKLSLLLLCLALATSCANTSSEVPPSSSEEPQSSSQGQPVEELPPTSKPNVDWEPGFLPQFAPPEKGTPIVTLHTSMGDVKLMLFPKAAPLTVENFVTHCQNGYYDGVLFHRVINGFMIQTGDPLGTGMGGESIWAHPFEDEVSPWLFNFRGSLSMANSGYATNGSQFFINQGDEKLAEEQRDDYYIAWKAQQLQSYLVNRVIAEQLRSGKSTEELTQFTDELVEQFKAEFDAGITPDDEKRFAAAFDKYLTVGGSHWLDFKHAVFGQVIEGMEVVDAIATVPVTDDRPNEDIIIERTTVEFAK